jgi:Fic family protein
VKPLLGKMCGVVMYTDSLAEEMERLDIKASQVRQCMVNSSKDQIREFWSQLDLSTIYHDWALEGQVVSLEELDAALDTRAVTDANNLPLNVAIRAHKDAINTARELATRREISFTADLFREFHTFFVSDREGTKKAEYRKEIPLHRAYFHEICHPAKIETNMAQLLEWLNDPEELLSMHPIEWACKFHYRFMHIFPFVETSGKVGRTLMNMFLIRHGLLPAVIHATERQRYYEAIRQSQTELLQLLIESANSSLDAAQKFLRSAAMAS